MATPVTKRPRGSIGAQLSKLTKLTTFTTKETLMQLEEKSLAQLFAESDRIGDKYLTPQEIADRDAKLAILQQEISALARRNVRK